MRQNAPKPRQSINAYYSPNARIVIKTIGDCMTLWQALLLGIVQGLSEFLPISSSGHLLLLEKLLGNSLNANEYLFFNVAVHVGTLLAVLMSLRKTWLPLIKHPFCKTNAFVLVACLPTVALAVIFKLFLPKLIDGAFLGFGFCLTAFLLFLADNFSKPKAVSFLLYPQENTIQTMPTKHKRKISQSALYNIKTSILTGVMQGIAVLPGVSRSGATICTLRLCGIEKEQATTFSFLLSIPIIIGSAIYEILPVLGGEIVLTISPLAIVIGMVCAFISGLLSINFFLKLTKHHSMSAFSIYTLLLGILVSVLPLIV